MGPRTPSFFLRCVAMQYSAPAGTRSEPDEKCVDCVRFTTVHDIATFRHPLEPGRNPAEVPANSIFYNTGWRWDLAPRLPIILLNKRRRAALGGGWSWVGDKGLLEI